MRVSREAIVDFLEGSCGRAETEPGGELPLEGVVAPPACRSYAAAGACGLTRTPSWERSEEVVEVAGDGAEGECRDVVVVVVDVSADRLLATVAAAM